MSIFRRKNKGKDYFEEESLDVHFGNIMSWARDLERKDYNKLKKAMDKDYDAYQILRGIEPVDEDKDTSGGFQLMNEEVK